MRIHERLKLGSRASAGWATRGGLTRHQKARLAEGGSQGRPMSSCVEDGRTRHEPIPTVRSARFRRGADPFVEAPEYLGGFWVIDVADEEAAVGWAARASKALGGRIEVRAFQVPPGE